MKVKGNDMSEIQEHVAYLSQEIGPRPAGTEEEQRAALYVAEALQKEAQLPTEIEDFNCNPNHDVLRMTWCALSALFILLSFFLPVMVAPALIVTLAMAVLFALEALGKSPFSRMFRTGASQNVVAKYEPASPEARQSARRRKIILVANYDSGKIRRDLSAPLLSALPVIRWVELGAMVAAPLVLAVRLLAPASDMLNVVFNVLLGACLIVALLPVVAFVLQRVAAYNEGANCNAAGVAVLLEVASRIGRGRISEEDAGAARVHGEEEALLSGFVPEGAELVYEVPPVPDPDFVDESPEERLIAAKAAVAALSGKPVSSGVNIDISSKLVQAKEPPAIVVTDEDRRRRRAETLDAFAPVVIMDSAAETEVPVQPAEPFAAQEPAATVDMPEAAALIEGNAPQVAPVISGSEVVPVRKPSVPSWFKSAREKARRNEDDAVQVQRSRYADALDAALHEEPRDDNAAADDAAARLQRMRASVVAAATPDFDAVKALEVADGSDEAVVSATPQTSTQPGETVPLEPVASPASEPDVSEGATEATKSAAQTAAERTIAFIPVAIDEKDLAAVSSEGAASPEGGSAAALDPLGVPSIIAPAEDGVHPARKKRSIALPSLTGSFEPLSEAYKQRAPLAEDGASRKEALSNLRVSIPSVESIEGASAQRRAAQDSLRASLPSLSGVIRAQAGEEEGAALEPETSNVSQAGSFASPAATGAFTPVGEELLSDVAPEDMYIEDADDSDYDDKYTETGAYAGPGYVEMPKSRASRFLDKFKFGRGKKNAQEESTPQEWLDVEDDFEAREVGRARGGWESFRDDAGEQATTAFTPLESDAAYDDCAEYDDGYYYDDDYDDGYGDGSPAALNAPGGSRPWNGGGFSRADLDEGAFDSEDDDLVRPHRATGERTVIDPSQEFDMPTPVEPTEGVYAATVDQIYSFRHPDVHTEVWFVALGSELAGNAGMSAFIEQHADELKGAIVVELDGLGAGDLTLIEREGTYRPVKSSSRMKRFTRKAATALGISVGSSTMLWKDGAAAYAARHGVQTMHMAGLANGKPAYFGEDRDTYDKVDENTMLVNADFVMEVLKNV